MELNAQPLNHAKRANAQAKQTLTTVQPANAANVAHVQVATRQEVITLNAQNALQEKR